MESEPVRRIPPLPLYHFLLLASCFDFFLDAGYKLYDEVKQTFLPQVDSGHGALSQLPKTEGQAGGT